MEYWVQRFTDSELPALAAVVQELQRLAGDDQTSVKQLADVLLRDAALTSKVLKVANSAYYNPMQEGIRTISRAIVLLGFANVRSISLSTSLVDALLQHKPHSQLLELLARAFHAAVQARNIAGYLLVKDQEEVFVAALLYHLGELAFWSCADDEADTLFTLQSEPGADADACVRQVLGVSFSQLSQGLAKAWNLGENLVLSHGTGPRKDAQLQAISLGVRISDSSLKGWETPSMERLIAEMATVTGISPDEAMQQVLQSAEEAVSVVATFGDERLASLIPSTDPEQIALQQQQRKARLLQPNLQVLQACLQDMSLLASKKGSVDLLIETLLRGLHQGAGIERVMVAVLTDGQRSFKMRQATGEGFAEQLAGWILPVDVPEQRHVFSYVLRDREVLWMGVPATSSLSDLITLPLLDKFGKGMFFIAPVMAGNRPVGVLYADSRSSGRALRNEQFVAFKRFSQLINRGLEAITAR
nr:HDOD domain-containing protein [Atopomonas sediminilitoris]